MKTGIVTIETLMSLDIPELKDRANAAAERCQQTAKKTVHEAIESGMALMALKEKVPHGEWMKWLGVNWDYSGATARTYMALASNCKRLQFENAVSIREAIGQIAAESESAEVPRESRKPGMVKVAPVGQAAVQADHIVDADEMVDDDPAPYPPTIRKTAAGSQKVKEADKPKTRPVVAEVLPDDPMEIAKADPVAEWFDNHSLSDILGKIVERIEEEKERKKAAKELRKLADKLDPPTKFVRPDLEEVSAYFRELNAADPDSFFDFYESKGWMVGKVSMKDWRASARKWVRENQANPFGNGKANGNGHKRGSSADDFIARNAAKLRETFGCD